ncbi:WD40 repeat domain-containing protein [Rhodobacter sp. CZR27]|uniref:WD40 repeat domain-containing protein n=1 Tax=Rhodobacter sp. CZR27 TaxID=2033869 RepID=UPI000BBE654C|nr:High-affnity carbon uptake protein Hat/HatR [Rhodobacter sp. CZR27]
MNQTLALTPFDLLSRRWLRPAEVCGAIFEASGKAVVFRDVEGRLALAPVADAEDTPARLRLELETGRAVIRPRQHEPAPLAEAALVTAAIAPFPGPGVLAADAAGALHRVTPRGQVTALAPAAGPVKALACDPVHFSLVIAREAGVEILDADLRRLGHVETDRPRGIAVRDGRIAVAHAGGLTLRDATSCRHLAIPEPEGAPALDPSGSWAAGRTAAGGLWLAEIATGRIAHLADFPLPPASVGFDTAGRLVTSGAYRLTAWSLDRPPFEDGMAGALRTGRPGLVAVTAAAPHPRRDVVAVGRANGELALARLGQPDEMVLRPGDGDAIGVLVWSADGRHLAIGTRGGLAALVDFPAQIFK